MRASQHLQLYSILFLFLTTFSAAWPWPAWLPDLDSLVVRQDTGDKPSSATSTQSSSSPQKTGSDTTSASASASQTNQDGPSGTATDSQSGTITTKPKTTSSGGTKKTSSATRKTSYDARLPPGGVQLLTPAATSTPYFKIGDYVTFAWNYTSLSATPTAINIVASCSANSQIYTLAANQTVTNATQAVTWDTGSYQTNNAQNPLLTQQYTLIIYDADTNPTTPPQAGYLAAFNRYTFGMYTPQAYQPLDGGFKCATCSGALGDVEKRALGFVLGMGALTVLSFTWFVGGTGVIW